MHTLIEIVHLALQAVPAAASCNIKKQAPECREIWPMVMIYSDFAAAQI